LLDTLAAYPRLAKYMDMPLQHASRNMLAGMKRGSHRDAFLKLLERIARQFPAFGCELRSSWDFPVKPRKILTSSAISCARGS